MIDTSLTLVNTLRERQILNPSQLKELDQIVAHHPEPRALARELLQRGMLTAFQVNRLLQGQENELFLGPYLLLERLGAGGMGQVFKARQRIMNRVVALKVIRKERLSTPQAAERFLREIQAASQLAHPHIAMAYDAAQVGETLYFAMEYVEGADLAKVVAQRGPLPATEACEYIRQAALGLQHAHEKGLVHRDIKPHNLMLTKKEGQIRVLDLGLARLQQTDSEPSGNLTHEGSIVGTPDYMAPEQVCDSHQADPRADIYSLGCTLYHLLAGHAPFASLPISQKVGAHISREPAPIESLRKDLPDILGDVLRKMMAKRPQDRYQTPAEVAAVLESLVWRAVPGSPPLPPRKAVPEAPAQHHLPTVAQQSVVPTMDSVGPTAVREDSQATQLFPTALPVEAPAAVPAAQAPRRWTRRQLLLAGLGAGAATLIPLSLLLRRNPKDRPSINPPSEKMARYPWYPRELLQVLGDDRGRHWGPVRALAYRGDGGLIASAGDDNVIRLWDAETLREKRLPLTDHKVPIRQMLFTPDGKSLLCFDTEGTPCLWDVDKGELLRRFAGNANLYQLFLSDDGRLVRGLNTNMSILSWDLATTESMGAISTAATSGQVTSWDVASDRKSLIVAENTPTTNTWFQLRVVDAVTGKSGPVVPGTEKPSGYDRLSQEEKARTPPRSLTQVSTSRDGRLVLSLANDGEVEVWDTSDGKRLRAFPRSQSPVIRIALSPSGKYALLHFQNGDLAAWDVANAQEHSRLEGHKGAVVCIVYSPDESRVLTGSVDGTLREWDLATGKERNPRGGHTHVVHDVCFSEDGKQVLSGGADATARLWDVEHGQEQHVFRHKAAVISVGFLPGGSEIFSIDQAYVGRRWEVAGERIVFSFDWGGTYSAKSIRYSRKDPVAYMVDTTTVYRRSLITGALVGGGLSFSRNSTEALAVSADGQRLLAAGNDPVVRYLDLKAARELKRFGGHANTVLAVAFSPEGRRALSVDSDGKLRRWLLDGNGESERVVSLEGLLPKVITSMTFSPDSTLLACTGYTDAQGEILLWDVETGKYRVQPWRIPGPVHRLAFAPDSTHLATANANGIVYVYRLERNKAVPGTTL